MFSRTLARISAIPIEFDPSWTGLGRKISASGSGVWIVLPVAMDRSDLDCVEWVAEMAGGSEVSLVSQQVEQRARTFEVRCQTLGDALDLSVDGGVSLHLGTVRPRRLTSCSRLIRMSVGRDASFGAGSDGAGERRSSQAAGTRRVRPG